MALELQLPPSVVTPADLVRLERALEMFTDEYSQEKLRHKARQPTVRPSQQLEATAQLNKTNLQLVGDRKLLLSALRQAGKQAPHVTMSFASDPSAQFMAKIVGWLRANTHPLVMVRIGLQPSIAAGCMLQTPAKVYDFSLQSTFQSQRPQLIARLREGSRLTAAVPAAAGGEIPVVTAPAKVAETTK